MRLTDLILEKALVHILEGSNTENVIQDAASLVDKYLEGRFGEGSEKLKKVVVTEVLLPLCKELMKDDKTQFIADLDKFRADLLKIHV